MSYIILVLWERYLKDNTKQKSIKSSILSKNQSNNNKNAGLRPVFFLL